MNLAQITARVDALIKQFEPMIEAILDGLTAEAPNVAALFDRGDREGMQIYHELGLREGGSGTHLILDVLEEPLLDVASKHRYAPIDEASVYEAGTILLYVFTCNVVVARRFETFAGVRRGLREVRRTRDVQFKPTSLRLEGDAARDLIVQWCGHVLQELWDGNHQRVALIRKASHGAKAGFIDRSAAINGLRGLAGDSSPPDRDAYRGMADELASAPDRGKVHCLFQGWGTTQVLTLAASSLTARSPGETRRFGKPEEDLLYDYIVACRDQKRAIGIFEKGLDKVRESPASTSLAELLALLRHEWNNWDAIQAKIDAAAEGLVLAGSSEAIGRLRIALTALSQATSERRRGGAVNARGGAS